MYEQSRQTSILASANFHTDVQLTWITVRTVDKENLDNYQFILIRYCSVHAINDCTQFVGFVHWVGSGDANQASTNACKLGDVFGRIHDANWSFDPRRLHYAFGCCCWGLRKHTFIASSCFNVILPYWNVQDFYQCQSLDLKCIF